MDTGLVEILKTYSGPKLSAGVISQIERFRCGELGDREANDLISMLGPDADELLFSNMPEDEDETAPQDYGDSELSADELAWREQYVAQEEQLRRQEAEMMQKVREMDLERMDQELVIKKAARQLAIGIGGSAMRLAKSMNLMANEIEQRVTKEVKSMTAGEMRAYIQSGANLIEKSTKALRVALELERMEEKQYVGGGTAEEEEDMTAEDALEIMANLREVSEMAGSLESDKEEQIGEVYMALSKGDKKDRKALGHLVHEDLWEEENKEVTAHYVARKKEAIDSIKITAITRGSYKEDGVQITYYLTNEMKADHCTLCKLGLCIQRVESSDDWDEDAVTHCSAYCAHSKLLS